MRIPEEIVEEIFEIIKKENNLQKDKHISNYFSILNKNLAVLRGGYRNNHVKIDYKDKKNQEVYLITYFPLYTIPIIKVLEYINKEHSSLNIPHNLCLIGAGPAPEIIGFLKFINNQLNSKRDWMDCRQKLASRNAKCELKWDSNGIYISYC